MCRLTRAATFLMSWHGSCGHVVKSDAGYRSSNPRLFGTDDTKFHSDPLSSCTSRTVPAYCASSRLSQAHKPEHQGVRCHDCMDPDVEPGKLKTVNNALLTLRFSCDYGSAKRHTNCVATHVFFWVVFERDKDLPLNTRQQPSHMEERSNATEVLKSKDRDLPRQTVKTPLCNQALRTGQTKLTMCFVCMLEQMPEMWPICARNRDSI